MKLPLHRHLTNGEIAEVLAFISEVLGMKAANFFRAKAYSEAGASIANWSESLLDIYQKHSPADAAKIYDQIPGLGEKIAKKLIELFTTGDIKSFQKYVKNLPAGMWPLCRVSGIGAKRAYRICRAFTVSEDHTLTEVLSLAEAGKIREVEGFGEKSEQDLIVAIKEYQARARMPLTEAEQVADRVVAELKKCQSIVKIAILGSLRRQLSTIGDVDLGIASSNIEDTRHFIEHLKLAQRVVVSGDGLMRLILKDGHQVDIKVSPLIEWGSFLQHFTGGKEHNIKLRKYALARGLSLSEHGITDKHTGVITTCATETEFYRSLGLKLIPPAERVGGDEIERYQENRL